MMQQKSTTLRKPLYDNASKRFGYFKTIIALE